MAPKPNLSPQLTRVFDRAHASSQEVLACAADDIEAVKAIAAGDLHVPRRMRTRALAVLVRLAPLDAERILINVLDDARADVDLRVGAAFHLCNVPSSVAEPVLLRALHAEEPAVRQRAMRALACVGGNEALRALYGLSAGDQSVAELLDFARAVIAFRLMHDDVPLPWKDPVARSASDVAHWPVFTVSSVNHADLGARLQQLRGPRYSIEISNKKAFEVRCQDKVPFLVLMNRQFADDPATFLRRPGLAGLLAQHVVELDYYAINAVVLVAPQDHGVRLTANRDHGAPLLAGFGERRDDRLTITVTDTPGFGRLPIRLVVVVDRGEVWFEDGRSLDRLNRMRVPRIEPR